MAKVISQRRVWRDENNVKHVEFKVIECECGQHVVLQFDDIGCDCGRRYNLFGQQLREYIPEGSYWDQ